MRSPEAAALMVSTMNRTADGAAPRARAAGLRSMRIEAAGGGSVSEVGHSS
jgi:hypothetical protein